MLLFKHLQCFQKWRHFFLLPKGNHHLRTSESDYFDDNFQWELFPRRYSNTYLTCHDDAFSTVFPLINKLSSKSAVNSSSSFSGSHHEGNKVREMFSPKDYCFAPVWKKDQIPIKFSPRCSHEIVLIRKRQPIFGKINCFIWSFCLMWKFFLHFVHGLLVKSLCVTNSCLCVYRLIG